MKPVNNVNVVKPIKIVADNAAAIEAALAAVNGKSAKHTYTLANEIIYIAESAESNLMSLLARKSGLKGAVVTATSGGSALPNSYKYTRQVTHVKLERRSTHWWLVVVEKGELFSNQSGEVRLALTKEQDERAVEVIRKQYSVFTA